MEPDERNGQSKSQSTTVKILLSPLIGLNKLLTAFLNKAVGDGKGTEDYILSMVDAGEERGEIEEESAEMISNVFEFDDMNAGDVMTHRVNIVGVKAGTSLDDIIHIALDKGFSRIPVYEKNIDNIIGLIIVKDLLCLIGNDKYNSFDIKDFLRDDILFIPESCGCLEAFREITAKKTGMAVVVDEYGGTAGILTLEDLIEAVMGDIEDEYDDEDDEIKQIGKETYEVDGDADPEEVLELFGYELPENHEYDTIAGFVTDLLGYIPEKDNLSVHVDYKDIRFVVKEVEDNFITKVLAKKQD